MKAKGFVIQVLSPIIFLLFISYAHAEQPLSLIDAIDIALKNSPEYIMAQHRLQQADEKIAQAWGMLYPALESEASAMRQYAENGFMSLSDGQYDLKFVQVRFGINPATFYNSLSQSYNNYKLAKEEVKKVKSSIEYNVIKSYFDVITANEIIRLRENSIAVLQANVADVNQMFNTGTIPKFELLQAQVQLQSQEPLLIEARNNFSTALDLFNYYLGAKNGTYTVIFEGFDSSIKEPHGYDIVDTLVEKALMHRPEVIQLTLTRDIVGDSIDAAQSVYLWPTFSVAGYYGKSYLMPDAPQIQLPFPGQSIDLSAITGTRQWQTTWQVRVAATYRWGALAPVDTVQGVEREQKEKLKEINQQILQLKQAIAIAVRADYGRLMTAYQSMVSQRKNIETATEGLRVAKESYKAGVIKNADLLNAELQLTSARMGYIKAINDFWYAVAQLKKDTGFDCTDLIFAEVHNEK
ncbi:MAG TPA: TolC family protein [Spirochaetota bacterium]|nr:TolC family protein [Spirochaetota bacterium]HOM09548.1 TolC family protein [Spirochaetota bacterium]HPP49525.1 TolC family protein [Spirochaetota bacterium]HXK65510.1 TolC family protein [Spirochaetota bacterium]